MPKKRANGQEVIKKQNQFLEILKRLSLNKAAMAGMIIFILVLLVAIFGDLIAPYDYAAVNPAEARMAPCAAHWFGTDNMGRDIFSRVLVGCKWSLIIGIGAQLIACSGGIIIGCISGFFGGKLDQTIMRLCDVIQSVPSVLLNITLAGIFGPGLFNTVLALGLSGIIGASALTYLGLGVQPPNPEWGALVSSGRDFLKSSPYMTIIPGLCILVVVLALNLFGDGLRDAMDPKLKK